MLFWRSTLIEKSLAYIANYLWEQCVHNINTILSDQETKSFNINDYFYLTSIHNMGTPNFGEVAEALHLTKPAISALVKRLSKTGLIEKVQSEEDRRVYFLKVTAKGTALIEGDNKLYAELTHIINSITGEEERQQVGSLLGRVVNELKKH